MRGKLIVIEGTNSSGKQTQAKMLVDRLNKDDIKSVQKSFPDYDTSTGRIIKDCLLSSDYFKEEIPPKVASLYYAADRAYNIDVINKLLNDGVNVILDRYTHSNMAYQAAKFSEISDKINMLLWMEQLEFNLLDLPRPDKVIFLYFPLEYNDYIKDKLELKDIEKVYGLMTERYNFDIINCIKNDNIRKIDDISDEIYQKVKKYIVNDMTSKE